MNAGAGTATAAREALASAGGFDVREIEGGAIAEATRESMAAGSRRIAVVGGDGTIGAAAGVLAGTGIELAVIPGGTLNHFARDLGIPTTLPEAAALAAAGAVRAVDAASVNGRLFLNTSSVGAYVVFVRARERLEQRMGYRLASALAAVRTIARMPRFRVEIEVDGVSRSYLTPMVFVGVGERELQLPVLGSRVPDGRAGLHLFVVRGRTRTALLGLAVIAAARGWRYARRTPRLDSFVVDRLRIVMRRPTGNVAVDGELVSMQAPLEYTIHRGALQVVCGPG